MSETQHAFDGTPDVTSTEQTPYGSVRQVEFHAVGHLTGVAARGVAEGSRMPPGAQRSACLLVRDPPAFLETVVPQIPAQSQRAFANLQAHDRPGMNAAGSMHDAHVFPWRREAIKGTRPFVPGEDVSWRSGNDARAGNDLHVLTVW